MARASLVPVLLVCTRLVAQAPAAQPGPEVRRMALQEAIQVALKNNLQVEIAKQSREITRSGVLVNEGAFDWNLAANASVGKQDGASTGASSHNTNTLTKRTLGLDVAKAFGWGGSLSMTYNPVYSSNRNTLADGLLDGSGNVIGDLTTTTAFPWTSGFSATYSQNLLQGFGREMASANLIIAKTQAQTADFTFQLAIINLVSAIETQYWDLVYAERFLANKRTSLELAQRQLKENTIRMQVGTMAPIDVTSAEAQVAQAEQDIISAEARLANAKDALMRSLFPTGDRPAGIETTDAPTLPRTKPDEEAAVKMALERRVELKAARNGKSIAELQAKVAQNRTLPQLSAFATYGSGSDNHDAFGSASSDALGLKYPGYTVGLKFAMPVLNRAAKGNLSIARASLRNSELGLKDQELSIMLEARTAVRNLEAAEKGVKAAEKTRYFQEKNLEAERKKFENGMSTNFVVMQVMTNLDNAKSAELQSQITYAKAVTALEQAMGNLLDARKLALQ